MTEHSFNHHRNAALALLGQCPDLPHKTAGFLGHVCVAPSITDPQRNWLVKLLVKNGLPPLTAGGAQ